MVVTLTFSKHLGRERLDGDNPKKDYDFRKKMISRQIANAQIKIGVRSTFEGIVGCCMQNCIFENRSFGD